MLKWETGLIEDRARPGGRNEAGAGSRLSFIIVRREWSGGPEVRARSGDRTRGLEESWSSVRSRDVVAEDGRGGVLESSVAAGRAPTPTSTRVC